MILLERNLAQPGKRMLSSMTPTVLVKDGRLFMVTGSPGGRTIINTVLQTIVNVIDFGMNAQKPSMPGASIISGFRIGSPTSDLRCLRIRCRRCRAKGHDVREGRTQGVAEVIVSNVADGMLEGGVDRRQPDGGAASQ